MADWRYHTTALRTAGLRSPAVVTGTVPLSGVTYTKRINAPGEFHGNLQLSSDDVKTSNELMRLLPAAQSVIHAERNGKLVADGILWAKDYTSATESYRLDGDSMLSWLARRKVDFTKQFSRVEPLQLVRYVVDQAQVTPGGAIGLSYDQLETTLLRDDLYEASSGRTILEHVTALADAATGSFEFAIDTTWSIPQLAVRRHMQLGFPRLGFDSVARAEAPPHVLTYIAPSSQADLAEGASNCSSYKWTVDASTYANRVIGVSRRNDGTTDVHIESYDAPQLKARIDASVTFDNLQLHATLVDRTRRALLDAERPPVLPEFTVVIDDDEGGNADLAPGTWVVGDDILCRITDPLRFPDSDRFPVEFLGRIEAATVTVDPSETVTFTVRPLPGQELPE